MQNTIAERDASILSQEARYQFLDSENKVQLQDLSSALAQRSFELASLRETGLRMIAQRDGQIQQLTQENADRQKICIHRVRGFRV